jgi:hypothetical protein
MSILTAASLVLVLAALSFIVISWRFRAVLGGVLGVVAATFALYALTAGPARGAALFGALLALLIGIALLALGQLVDRLLRADPPQDA